METKWDEDIDDENNQIPWEEEAFTFIKDIFVGIEREVFKKSEENKILQAKLKEMDSMLLGVRLIECYLTNVYKQLLDRQDQYIVETFEHYGNVCKEEPKFMLNLISNVINKTYPMFQRSKLDVSNQYKYLDSVRSNVDIMKKFICTLLKELLEKLKKAKKEANVKD